MYMYVVVVVLNLSTYIYIFSILEKSFQWYVPAIFRGGLYNLSTTTENGREARGGVVGIVIALGVYIMCHLIGWETNWMRQRISK